MDPASAPSTAMASAWFNPLNDNGLYQANGMGRPVPNPSSSRMKDHPYGPPRKLLMFGIITKTLLQVLIWNVLRFSLPAVVPVGHMAMANPHMMKQMSASTLKAMMENANDFNHFNEKSGFPKVTEQPWSHEGNGNTGPAKKHPSAGGDENNSFSQDTLQAGNSSNKVPTGHGDYDLSGPMSAQPSYYGTMGMGVPPGMGGNGPMPTGRGPLPNTGNTADFSSEQSPENYRDFFRNMRNVFPPNGGPGLMPSGMYGQSHEEYQRFVMAKAMSQNGGMHLNGKER